MSTSTQTSTARRGRIVVLISGSGTNLQALLDASTSGRLCGDIVAVFSNRADAFGLERARRAGVDAHHASYRPFRGAGREAYDADLARRVLAYQPDLVVLAGWMRVLTPAFLDHFPTRIVNLHPALPHDLAGIRAIERAHDEVMAGTRTHTGVMVHLVEPEVDAGPVLGATIIPCFADESLGSLAQRIHTAEHKLLVTTVHAFLGAVIAQEDDMHRSEEVFRVELTPKHIPDAAHDAHASWRADAASLGVHGLRSVFTRSVYFMQGAQLTEARVQELLTRTLQDPLAHTLSVHTSITPCAQTDNIHTVEITRRPGVTDTEAETLLHIAHELGFDELERVACGRIVELHGDLTTQDTITLATSMLANEVVETFTVGAPIAPPFVHVSDASEQVETFPIRDADNDALAQLNKTRRLALSLEEMRAVRGHYRALQRDPTDVELEMIAQTWSEHCVHKTFRARIDMTETDARGEEASRYVVDSMFKTYIHAVTDRLASEVLPEGWLRSVFVDNAGIVAFDDAFDVAFKVETHNHPSALEPFGGANTGVGGVVRDILGVSARPIANTDVLCFGPTDTPHDALPDGVLHPHRVERGVVAGIEDYGNKMGIPTVNGAILYDPGYTANPLVFCGCLGILPRDSHASSPKPGDHVIAIGGATGLDGIGGATFSSMEMDHTTSQIAGSSVQIGHPIAEKQVQEVVLQARDEQLYTAITDCGAGGFSSAVGEMAAELGADIQLEAAPLKYPGLAPWQIWLSEAQERMVFAIPPKNLKRFREICEDHHVTITDLGTFRDDGRLYIRHGDRLVGDLSMPFLDTGRPQLQLTGVWHQPSLQDPHLKQNLNTTEALTTHLLALLSAGETRSKADVIRQYDHEVQGGTVIKPLVGACGDGPGDAAVILPLDAARRSLADDPNAPLRGVALSVGVNPFYGQLDPWKMSWAVIDEAVRNAVAVGADPDRLAILDNFCWGNPRLPDRLGALVRCVQGCHDAALAYGAPFISGKDSLNNEYTDADGQKHAIPGTLLVSALGIVPDIRFTTTSDFKRAGNLIYLLGETRDELGGSSYLRHLDVEGGTPPAPTPYAPARYRALHAAMRAGLVRACHDLSDGGLGVALAELAFAGRLGAQVHLGSVPRDEAIWRDDVLLFSESSARHIVEVTPEDRADFEAIISKAYGDDFAYIGVVNDTNHLHMTTLSGGEVVLNITHIGEAWQGHLPDA